MLFEQQSYLLHFVISVIKHCLRQTHIEGLLLWSLRCQPLLARPLDIYRLIITVRQNRLVITRVKLQTYEASGQKRFIYFTKLALN